MLKKILSRDNLYPPPEIYSEIDNGVIIEMWNKYITNGKSNKLGLYIHIPFCKSKCTFCHCRSLLVNDDNLDKYLEYLNTEIETFSGIFKGKKKIDNIYFGGGTPSILDCVRLEKFLRNLQNKFDFIENIPFCFEAMPETLTEEKIDILAKYGVTRLSLGVQSLDKKVLKSINRMQEVENLNQITKYAKNKIKYINLDLVCGLEGETLESFEKGLDIILDINPDIIHIYRFDPAETTIFTKSGKKYNEENRNLSKQMYQLALRKIFKSGRIKLKNDDYGIELEARNMTIVDRIENASSNLGIGYSARSNIFSELSYVNSGITDDNLIYKHEYKSYLGYSYGLNEEKNRYILQNLIDGLNLNKYKLIFNSEFLIDHKDKIRYLLEKYGKEVIINNNGEIKFNLEKFPNYIINSILFSNEVIQKIKQYEIG